MLVLSFSKVKIASFFSNQRNFESERDTSDVQGIKALDLQEIYKFDLSGFIVTPSVKKLQRFEMERLTRLRLLVQYSAY